MPLPRRLQLLRLLAPRGLRSAERHRGDEVREALSRLRNARAVRPVDLPSSPVFAKKSESQPAFIDEDDPHALPRFREPRLSLPDHERTFLRAIAQKPRVCFFTWDVSRERRARANNVRLEVRFAEFLGDPPDAAQMIALSPALVVDVDVSAGGWYVPVPAERLAVIGRLVDDHGEICTSNVTLTPPARPAPPGPLWLATLPPALDRRRLVGRALLSGDVAEADLRRAGETDASLVGEESASSGELWALRSSSVWGRQR